jgi:hypothetical protein
MRNAMQALNESTLIDLWERGYSRHPLDRALLLVAAAAPELPATQAADLSLSVRDARVLQLRLATFGERFNGVADCPQCAQPLEFEFPGSALDSQGDKRGENDLREFASSCGLRFRLPSSRDLAAALAANDTGEALDAGAVRTLLHRCCLNASADTNWSSELYEEADAGLSALAQRHGLVLTFCCEACGTQWDAPLDICGWVWNELDQRVKCLLDDVHRLAWAYGWDEDHILSMRPARRAAYLERCEA